MKRVPRLDPRGYILTLVLDPLVPGSFSSKCRKGVSKPLLLTGKQFSVVGEIKHGGHEVFRACVLIKATNQIPHRSIKLFRVHDRRVEQELAHGLTDRVSLIRGHPNQHFKIDARVDAAPFGEQVRKCHVKEVVSGYTNSDRFSSSRR